MATRRYGRRSVEASNEDKILFPAAGITKGALIDYYERIADRILPHLKGRPLVLQRHPDGIQEEGFYQKQVGSYFPDWISTVHVEVGTSKGSQELVVCDKKATLAYLANQACIALHPWLSRADRLDDPDLLVIDLDPPGDDFESVRKAALRVRDLLEELELVGFPKLTGSKGVHVVVPLDRHRERLPPHRAAPGSLVRHAQAGTLARARPRAAGTPARGCGGVRKPPRARLARAVSTALRPATGLPHALLQRPVGRARQRPAERHAPADARPAEEQVHGADRAGVAMSPRRRQERGKRVQSHSERQQQPADRIGAPEASGPRDGAPEGDRDQERDPCGE